MSQYWNGYRWVDDPPMAKAEPSTESRSPTEEERAAIVDAELRPRTITEESQPLVEAEIVTDPFVMCDSCSSEYDSRDGECPVCLMLGKNLAQSVRDLDDTIKVKPEKEVVISDEVRERLRRELGIKVDGGSK